MADSAIGITNPRLDSKVVIRYTDKEMWSEAQEFAYVRLTSTRDYKVNLWGVPEVTVRKHLLAGQAEEVLKAQHALQRLWAVAEMIAAMAQ
jgi:hypothetical protein